MSLTKSLTIKNWNSTILLKCSININNSPTSRSSHCNNNQKHWAMSNIFLYDLISRVGTEKMILQIESETSRGQRLCRWVWHNWTLPNRSEKGYFNSKKLFKKTFDIKVYATSSAFLKHGFQVKLRSLWDHSLLNELKCYNLN